MAFLQVSLNDMLAYSNNSVYRDSINKIFCNGPFELINNINQANMQGIDELTDISTHVRHLSHTVKILFYSIF